LVQSVTLPTCIWEGRGSDLGWDIGYPEVSRGFQSFRASTGKISQIRSRSLASTSLQPITHQSPYHSTLLIRGLQRGWLTSRVRLAQDACKNYRKRWLRFLRQWEVLLPYVWLDLKAWLLPKLLPKAPLQKLV
jgi:hypothetical protein